MRPAATPLALAAVVLVAATGCDPIVGIRGVVRAAPTACAAPASGPGTGLPPLAGAEVSLACPGVPSLRLGTTDAGGHVEYANVGLWATSCRVVIAKAGYRTQSFSLEEICSAREGSDDCHFSAFVAELPPER